MKIDYWEKLEANVIYHVYNRAIGKENLFQTPENYRYFLQKWKEYLPYLDVFAYCLMPNHFHFLIKVKPLTDDLRSHLQAQTTAKSRRFLAEEIPYSEYLEDQFKRLLSSYALAYNKQYQRNGSLFQKRFKRISIPDEYKLHYLLAYIHHNPLRHRFCATYETWKYTSWLAYQSLEMSSSINRTEVLSWFGADTADAHQRFLKFHEDFRLDRKMESHTLEEE